MFCAVRDAHSTPLREFYAALAARVVGHFGIAASARVERCHAVDGSPACVVALDLGATESAPVPAIAA